MVELTPGSLSDALLTLMLGIAVCWLTLKVPSLLRCRHSQARLFNVIIPPPSTALRLSIQWWDQSPTQAL